MSPREGTPEDPSQEQDDKIQFHNEGISFQLNDIQVIIPWIEKVIQREGKELLALNYIFCSDTFLHQVNLRFLQHDTFTDIITFPYAEDPEIEGDIFISIERVKENAKRFEVSFEKELHRVMIHGVLHLCGYGDSGADEKKAMRSLEDTALALLS